MIALICRYPLGVYRDRRADMSVEKTYSVRGMTCEHCEQAVGSEVSRVPGVRVANADHRSGALVVQTDELDDEAIRKAVEAAGFELAA